jgi:hypothetical protein
VGFALRDDPRVDQTGHRVQRACSHELVVRLARKADLRQIKSEYGRRLRVSRRGARTFSFDRFGQAEKRHFESARDGTYGHSLRIRVGSLDPAECVCCDAGFECQRREREALRLA